MKFLPMLAASAAMSALMLAAPAQAFMHKNYHIFPMGAANGHQPAGQGDMFYYGGSVFSSVKLVSVIWNKNVLQTTQTQIPLFSAAIVDSTYLDQMQEYNTKGVIAVNGHKGTKQKIERGTYLGQFLLKPHNKSTSLTDADVQVELKHQIADGNLPPRDLNTLYMVYFPANISIDLQGSKSCQAFGAYHFATNINKLSKKNLFYSVEPECNQGLSFLTFVAAHEFAEATTDNVPTPGSNPDFPQAWNDVLGFEVGDKCSGQGKLTSTAGSWTVTQYYLNSLHGCSTKANYTSP